MIAWSVVLHLFLLLAEIHAFVIEQPKIHDRTVPLLRTVGDGRQPGYLFMSSLSTQDDDQNEQQPQHPMFSSSRLSHAMLKVTSVDRTVGYWVEKMGTVMVSRTNEDDGSLQSAFVALGNGTSTDQSFQLELVKASTSPTPDAAAAAAATTTTVDLGNCISYLGVSMLLQFQNNLMGAAAGETPQGQGDEPNGIPVRSCASAPGDYFCRLCLKSNDLVATHDFYTTILGMEAKAIDADMVCLRYANDNSGVPTTLVFEKTSNELNLGKCLDHIAIVTTNDVEEQYERIKEAGATICMNPTEMFGKKVMGVIDPNGYKVILAS